MKPLDKRSYAYVVRVWEERRELAESLPTWRGSIDDVQRGTRIYFGALSELCDYVRRRSGMDQPSDEAPLPQLSACRARRRRALPGGRRSP